MHRVLSHIGVTENGFYKLLTQAMQEGETAVVTGAGITSTFLTQRGIKQGCPASPLLFMLLLVGLQRRLCRLQLPGSVHFGELARHLTSYADDLKLFSESVEGLDSIFREVQYYLAVLGLTTAANKGFVMAVGLGRGRR